MTTEGATWADTIKELENKIRKLEEEKNDLQTMMENVNEHSTVLENDLEEKNKENQQPHQ